MTIKTLYVNGCSWSTNHGVASDPDFPKCNDDEKYHKSLEFTWPVLVANHLGAKLVNEAAGGGSNSRIVRMTCDFLRRCSQEEYKNLLVIIGWTAPERNEIYIEYDGKKNWHLFNPSQPFYMQFSNGPAPYPPHVMKDLEEYHEIYTKIIQNDRADLSRYFNQIYLMSNLLENLGIRYMFFSSIGQPVLKDRMAADYFSMDFDLLSDKKFLEMDKRKCMASFCRDNKIPLSPCMHPMIEGHKSWTNHLLNRAEEIWPNLFENAQ